MKINKYTDEFFDLWNKFIEESINGTIFHRLDFLNYHGNKFKSSEHHLMWFKRKKIIACLPFSILKEQNNLVGKSPFGGSFGGIVYAKNLSYKESNDIITSLINYLKDLKLNKLIITPSLNYNNHSNIIEFSYLSNGFNIINNEANHIIDMKNNFKGIRTLFRKSTFRNYKKSINNGVKVKLYSEDINGFWKILNSTFEKFQSKPTHSFSEWKFLMNNFRNKIHIHIAYFDNIPISGIGVMKLNNNCLSTFYIVNNPKYYEFQGLTAIFHDFLKDSKNKGYDFVDLGTSSYNMNPRENIFRFKESLGGIVFLRKTFQLNF